MFYYCKLYKITTYRYLHYSGDDGLNLTRYLFQLIAGALLIKKYLFKYVVIHLYLIEGKGNVILLLLIYIINIGLYLLSIGYY